MYVGLVGYGYWGEKLARAFTEACRGSYLTAIADPRPERQEAAKNVYPDIQTFGESQRMFEWHNFDAVLIATPPRTHFEETARALTYRKHVLVEKPLAFTTEEAEALIHAAERHNLQLMVDHTLCYTPLIHELKNQLLAKPWPHHIVSTRLNVAPEQLEKSGCNVMWDLAPHDLAAIDFLLNLSPVNVAAWGNTTSVMMRVNYTHDVSAEVVISWDGPSKHRDLVVAGDGYCISFDGIANQLSIPVEEPAHMYAEPLKNVMRAFQSSIVSNQPAISGPKQSLRVTRVLESAQCSLNNGGKAVAL